MSERTLSSPSRKSGLPEPSAGQGRAYFQYATSYRFYTLAKVGFSLAYLWFVADFVRIHGAQWNHLSLLLPDPRYVLLTGSQHLDGFLRPVALFLNSPVMVEVFGLVSPVAAALFLWGRRKWIQAAVGGWMSFSMISLNCLVGVFSSTVDVWLNLTFVLYALVAIVSSADGWEISEAGFSAAKWRANPTLSSTFAWLVVWLQFLVYFFAGVNKLVLGWIPWTTGLALQNLSIDSSMRGFARGVHVPYWISLVLCYVTLLQRLVVPFGFYFRRGRLWSVLILGTMHVGYAILMNVNLFPLMGIASLLVILPVADSGSPRLPARAPKIIWPRTAAVGLFALILVLESARLTRFRATPWENKLMVSPGWRMFADGGASAGGEWRIILASPRGRIDGTDLVLGVLPHSWRDRFYINNIFNDLMDRNMEPGSLVDRLGRGARTLYRDQQRAQGEPSAYVSVGFELYRWSPPGSDAANQSAP